MFSSDTVGETTMQVWQLLGTSNHANMWHKIYHEKKEAGEIRIEVLFESDNPAASQQQQAPQQL